MSPREQSKGSCAFCGREMTRGGMARHLRSCEKRTAAQADAEGSRRHSQTLYHLQVQDKWSGSFWLHLEMRGNDTLKDLDYYLREIWLECCGHLSSFDFGEVLYTQIFDDGMGYKEERPMSARVKTLFSPGMEIPYEYDFGSTTELVIKVVDQREGKPLTAHPIFLMARNRFEPPPCVECGKPSTQLCAECLWEEDGRGTFCDDHAEEHDHPDMLMPFVNSPRAGECGYIGPAEPPY